MTSTGTVDENGILLVEFQKAVASLTVNGETELYPTVTAALEAAASSTSAENVLKLLADVEGGMTIESGTFTLDLNGYTVAGANGPALVLLDGNVTFIDSSAEKTGRIFKSDGNTLSVFGGKAIIDGIILEGRNGLYVNDAQAVVRDITIIATGYASTGVGISGSGKVEINGGTVNCSNLGVLIYDDAGSCTITGGTVKGGPDIDIYIISDGTLTITGGSFRHDPSDWVAEGYTEKWNSETELYDVVKGYKVEIEQPEDGKVETDKDTPAPGEDVTVTVTPDEGKEVADVTVKDENGNEIDVNDNGDGTYTYEQPDGNVSVEVSFRAKSYKVTFVDDNGTVLREQTVEHAKSAVAPADPVRTGYTFTGWDKTFESITGPLTVTAKYSINKYTIAFAANGGSEVTAITQNYNTTVVKPADPTKTGYDFGGWYADAELTSAYVFGTMPADNITVYAKWNPASGIAYTVKHYHQNISGSGYDLYESETLRGITNTETAAAAKNYSGFTAQSFAQTTILPDGSTVVEIKYDRNVYTVTLVADGGIIRADNVTEYTYGVGAKLPTNVTRGGFYFGGWYDNKNCSGTAIAEISAADIGNKTFYAKWIFIFVPIVTPTYPPVVEGGAGGAVAVTPKNPEKGSTVTVKPAPDSGFEVDKVTVTDKNGTPVTVTDNGDGTYSFKQPSGKVNVEVTFKETVKVCPGDKTCPMYGYTDLDRSAWYHDGVHFCLENKLMNGMSATTFAPGEATSRAMIVTILWRLAGEPVVNYAMSFKDVTAGAWYTEAIRWAASQGIVNGYSDAAFGPNDNITREQLAAILYRYEQKNGGGFKGMWMFRMDYVDLADVSDWAFEAICWMNMNSIVNGKPGKIMDPKGSATRAEAAVMLQRYCDVISKSKGN